MYIGELARLGGATPKAIRLYESLGLIPKAARRGRYRTYTRADIVLVHMIRRGQAVGFSLAEMKQLLVNKARTGRFDLAVATGLIARKRTQLRAAAEAIAAQDRRLQELHEEITRTFGMPARRKAP
jgi:MerR family transcriptional regulator, copper efflux regulator